jgi:Tudor domain
MFNPLLADVKQLQAALNEKDWGAPMAGFDPVVGTVIASQFVEDNDWYRARVTKVLPGKNGIKEYALSYIDYGNVCVFSHSSVCSFLFFEEFSLSLQICWVSLSLSLPLVPYHYGVLFLL